MLTTIITAHKDNQWEVGCGMGINIEQYSPIEKANGLNLKSKNSMAMANLKYDIEDIIKEKFLFFKKGLGNNYVGILNKNTLNTTLLQTETMNETIKFIKTFFLRKTKQNKKISQYKDQFSWAIKENEKDPQPLTIKDTLNNIQAPNEIPVECFFQIPFLEPETDEYVYTEEKENWKTLKPTLQILQNVKNIQDIRILYSNKDSLIPKKIHETGHNFIGYSGNKDIFITDNNQHILFRILFNCESYEGLLKELTNKHYGNLFNSNFTQDILLFYVINYTEEKLAYVCDDDFKKFNEDNLELLETEINKTLRTINDLYVKYRTLILRFSLIISLLQKKPIVKDGAVLNKKKKAIFTYIQINCLSSLFNNKISNINIYKIHELFTKKNNILIDDSIWLNESMDLFLFIGYFINDYMCFGAKIRLLPIINSLINLIMTKQLDNIIELIFFLVTRILSFTLALGRYIITILFDIITYSIHISIFCIFSRTIEFTKPTETKTE